MPEGDTVFKLATTLHCALAGNRIILSDFRVPLLATSDLAGQRVVDVTPRGKHLLMRTDASLTLHTHLKMDGEWHLYRTGTSWPDRDDTVRVVIVTDEWTAVGTRLGIVDLIPTADENRTLADLGPDLLGPDWDAEEALRRLRARPDRRVGEALIDQTVMAGLGNVYRCEICFLRGVDPASPVKEAGDLGAMIALARKVIHANRLTGNQVTTGDARRGRRHWVYGRAGQPCRRCGTQIRRRDGDSSDRVTYWCPSCQPRAPDRFGHVDEKLQGGR